LTPSPIPQIGIRCSRHADDVLEQLRAFWPCSTEIHVPRTSTGLGIYHRQVEATFSALLFVVGLSSRGSVHKRTHYADHIQAKIISDAIM
jgi:hypothetical protein